MKHLYTIFALILTLSNITAQETIVALELDTAWEKSKKQFLGEIFVLLNLFIIEMPF